LRDLGVDGRTIFKGKKVKGKFLPALN